MPDADRPAWPAIDPDSLSTSNAVEPPRDQVFSEFVAGVDVRPAVSSPPTAFAPPPRASASLDRVRTAVDTWRRRLLDLTRRNRALNFRPTKVSTVTIVDEQPAEVFRQLCIEGKPMRFSPTLPSSAKAHDDDGRAEASVKTVVTSNASIENRFPTIGVTDGAWDEVADGEEAKALELDFAPYDPDTLADRHRDDILQAQATPEALDKSLRRLEEIATSTLEESGVNVLYLALGMLHYTESTDSDTVFRAPLLMVPVKLTRRSARSGFVIEANGDDPLVNPALAEYLQREFSIGLADLPSADTPEAATAVRDFFAGVADTVAQRAQAGFRSWAVKTDIFLSTFAFQKLVMFKDLEANAAAFGAHRLTHQVVSREAPVGAYVSGLPDDVRGLELDRDFAPERTAQVVDADSSQLRAIVAVSRGHDLVLEGPPGTGKSQTITNLIAQALADGKSVLFVAEKMAALHVVHSRLVRAGLGEFCLELHASKANKRLVMQELKTALDASLQRPSSPRRTQRLPLVRSELSAYAAAVHALHGALGISPFRAIGMLDALLTAPRIPIKRAIDDITLEMLEDTARQLDDLALAQVAIGVPQQHAWQGTQRTFYTPGNLQDIRDALDRLIGQLDAFISLAAEVQESFALPSLASPADVEAATAIATVFERSPGVPLDVLESDAWNAPPSDATEFVDAVDALQRQRQGLDRKFSRDAFEQDHADDIAFMERKGSGALSFLAILDGRYRAIKRRWLAYRATGYAPAILDQANDLKGVDRYRVARSDLVAAKDKARRLFGVLWEDDRTDVALLRRYIAWVVEARGVCIKHGLTAAALQTATKPTPSLDRVHALGRAADELGSAVKTLAQLVEANAAEWTAFAYTLLRDRLVAMRHTINAATTWGAFELARRKAATSPAAELVERAIANMGAANDVDFVRLSQTFRRAVVEKWIDQVMSERAPLREFSTLSHEQRLKEFRQLDEWILQENQASVVTSLRSTAQQRLQEPAVRAGLPILQQQLARQRNIMPLRKLLQHAEPTIRAIKPCFLMSPLTVAQYLDGRAPSFDLVIFDEASQLPTEDAIGAICRGKQLVVVGDPKQLPPTNFFVSNTGTIAVPVDGDGLPIVQDAESVLEEYMGAGVPVTRLKWHYRSAHESLIAFSNTSFYDSDLYTFPSVETGSGSLGLSFEFVADGVYEGKGMNTVEARTIVDAVVRHAKERPQESLGVGTFNIRQQLAILDELELRRRQDPTLEPFFSRGAGENFFVKNLENIQGDERDVIFLSVTYAKGADGRLRMNFGALNGENGWRRLNVITTRARKRMRVFSSMHGDEINAAGTTSRGAHLLREFLLYAEHGTLQSLVASTAAQMESPFEVEVVSELTRRGVAVVPQVGVAGYRIDIGVLDPNVPGRFVCGLECDGVAYHSSETARDRDRLRQQVLEARGWIIHRIWSTDWFKDRAGQIDRVLRLIDESRVDVSTMLEAERDAEAKARAEAECHQREEQERVARDEEARLTGARTAIEKGRYARPTVPAYGFASPIANHAGSNLLETPTGQLVAEITNVVAFESPVHEDDLLTRVAGFWATRLGSRISARVEEALAQAVQGGVIEQRGAFLWSKQMSIGEEVVPVRSRSGTRLSGERIAADEIEGAIRLVLASAGGVTSDELLTEVRQVLGVSKQSIANAVTSVVQVGMRRGWIGEGSTGLALRA